MLANPIPVAGTKKPDLVLVDRAADRKAEAVLNISGDRCDRIAGSRVLSRSAEIKKRTLFFVCVRVPSRPSPVLKRTTVELIGAALGHVVDDRTRGASVLDTKVVGNNRYFTEKILVAQED